MNTKNKRMLIMSLMIVSILILFGTIAASLVNEKKPNAKTYNKDFLAVYIQGDDGNYTVSDSKTFPTEGYELNTSKSICTNRSLLSQNDITKKINIKLTNNDACSLYFDIEASSITLNHLGGTSNGVKTNFDEPATTDEGIFRMADDYGSSYYYRGDVENNYVKFADFYWRIIRINGDGSLRIIYDGTSAHVNGENSTDRFTHTGIKFNENYDDAKYVGWMYGPAGTTASTSKTQAQTNTTSSTIKIVVDEWYKTNIVDKGYSSAVADVIFCNDRSTPGQSATNWNIDTGLGYGNNVTAFGFTARTGGWYSSTNISNPTFKCPQKNDAFTVGDTVRGNGASSYPVGLITADEVIAAGSGKYHSENYKYYLQRPSNFFWTMSPFMLSETGIASAFAINSAGYLGSASINYYNASTSLKMGGVAPVVNLDADYVKTMIGTGTMSDPYRAPNIAA